MALAPFKHIFVAWFTKRTARAACLALCSALASCGGGGDGGGSMPLPNGDVAQDDRTAYASTAGASLPRADEAAATTHHTVTLNGSTLAYTAKAGHLTASDPVSGAAKASFFYVAYTADGQSAATRPVTFFYNGGPGSASVWLHLGSFGPKRLATFVPGTSAARPFQLVDNAQSLLDVSDLVFVDAVGSGLSEAIAPFTNQSFWGVDADAEVFRDFVSRYLSVNGRMASPRFLFGESYGAPRTAVLANLMESAGMVLDGLVLQSSALNYNSNCGVSVSSAVSCAPNLPTYAAVGAYYGLVNPPPADAQSQAQQMRDYTASTYAPAVAALITSNIQPAPELPPQLNAFTGIATSLWQSRFNLDPFTYQTSLLPTSLIGIYDGRISAPDGSLLAGGGDPSSTLITDSFAGAIVSYLRDTLRYTSVATYVLLGSAINTWNFSHDGLDLPDTIPDLAAAMAQNPQLRVLSVNGYHDLVTPFHLTELDLARLPAAANVQVRNYAGGHMTYLDDASRPLEKADVAAFVRGTLAARAGRGPLEGASR